MVFSWFTTYYYIVKIQKSPLSFIINLSLFENMGLRCLNRKGCVGIDIRVRRPQTRCKFVPQVLTN